MVKTAKDSLLLNEHNRIDDVSWFTNISSCIWLPKVTNILKNTIGNKDDERRCINTLNEQVKMISSYRIHDIEKHRDIYNYYTSRYLNSSIGAVEQFITDCRENNISRYFNVKYIGNKRQKAQSGYKNPKNIIMDFDADYFAKTTGRIEDIPLYPTCYCHYFMIAFLLDIINLARISLPQYSEEAAFYENFLGVLNKNLNSSVLTGLKGFAEYELAYPYCCLYDELKKLTPLYKDKLVFFATPQNKSFEIKIKEYSLITEMFVKYRGVWSDKDVGKIIQSTLGRNYIVKHQDVIHINSDKEHDKVSGVFSTIRITEGSDKNRMRVSLTLSGQRIINRIFSGSGNVNNNVKTHMIIEYIPSTAHMIAFMLWVVLNCTTEANNKFQGFEYSNIPIFCQYIDEYVKSKGNKQPKNVAVNSAIPIMLSSKTKEEQEEFINSHFSESQSQQKALIRAGINRINEIKQEECSGNDVIPFTKGLIEELKNDYNW